MEGFEPTRGPYREPMLPLHHTTKSGPRHKNRTCPIRRRLIYSQARVHNGLCGEVVSHAGVEPTP